MNVVIIGSNRGIGLELVKQFLGKSSEVTASYRSDSGKLDSLDCNQVGGVDITEFSASDAEKFPEKIDVLIVNAGVLQPDSLNELDPEAISRQFAVNSLGPLRVVSALRSRLADPAKVILITSRMGSVEDNTSGGYYGYRMSKAALNMAGKSLAVDLRDANVAVGLIHPGYVKTDMTGHQGNVTPEESAKMISEVIEGFGIEKTGTFHHADGSALPW